MFVCFFSRGRYLGGSRTRVAGIEIQLPTTLPPWLPCTRPSFTTTPRFEPRWCHHISILMLHSCTLSSRPPLYPGITGQTFAFIYINHFFTCNLGLMVKLPAVGFIQATYWQLWMSFGVNLFLSYLKISFHQESQVCWLIHFFPYQWL